MRTIFRLRLVVVFIIFGVTGGVFGVRNRNYEETFDNDHKKSSDRSTRNWICFILGVCSISRFSKATTTPNLNLIFQWKQLEFDYSSLSERQNEINNGNFAVGEIAPIDVDVYYSDDRNNQIFVTVPKFRDGIPATLGTVTDKLLDGNPIIKPYPDWSWHRNLKSCGQNRLVSVFRVKIDECGRMWVLDTGKIGDDQICSPQLIAFYLKTNRVLHRYEFPSSTYSSISLFVTPEVDVRDPGSGCRNTFVYIADVSGFSIVVYDAIRNRSWKVQDKTLYPFPSYGTYDIEGDSFDLMDGVLGLAISPYNSREDRKLFYHAMSSPTENWVYSSYLRNESLFLEDASSSPQIFHTYPKERKTQTAAEAIDKDGVMFFGLMSECQIACWNINTDYGPKNWDIVATNHVTLQFPSGVKVIKNRKGLQELFIMTSRFQKVANGSLNSKEINFRIQAGKIEDLLAGTKCKSRKNFSGYSLKPSSEFLGFHGNGGSSGGYGLYVNNG